MVLARTPIPSRTIPSRAGRIVAGFCLVTGLAASGLVISGSRAALGAGDAGEKGQSNGEGIMEWLGNGQTHFYRMPPFNVPVIRDGQVLKQVTLSVTLETGGSRMQETVIERRRLLHSAFLSDLHAVLAIQAARDGVNLETVKIRLKRIADDVLGPGIARDVLVESAYVKDLR